MKEELRALINYRLNRAVESLEEARILLRGQKAKGAMNRVYYSMFYAALALLGTKGLISSKHSGVISLFHKEFVKTHLFPTDTAKFLDRAFDIRTKSDYEDFTVVEKEQVEGFLKGAGAFVEKTKELIDRLTKEEG